MDKHLDQLEQCLSGMTVQHEQLLSMVRRKLEAMRMAQPDLVADCCQRENEHVQAIARIEKRRQTVIGEITSVLAPGSRLPMTLGQIADAVGEPRRGRLLVMQVKLRQLMQRIQHENAVSRRATEGLVRHVTGVMQKVTAVVGAANTYGRRGVANASPATVSSFSLTA
ncbi:flagellar protein FlgN [Planctomycetales bacterium ZRK34]|nr:flagellar protein FlgN [Planctomycetales bacterium ZRK34]